MMTKSNIKQTTMKICITAMFMALNVLMSSFGIPMPVGRLYLNDAVICLAAICLDPISAFVVGGVGAFLGDLMFYPEPMFVSLVTHGAQAVAISLISRKISSRHKIFLSCVGVFVGAIIMVTGYSLGRAFVYGTPGSVWIKLPYQILQAGVGAILGIFLCWGCKIHDLYCRCFGELK